MQIPQSDRFVRFPTKLLEALLRARLTGTQWRVLLWVVRNTHGWNRNTASFSWYRIAKELSMDRGGVVRAGNLLLQTRVLQVLDGELGIQEDCQQWASQILTPRSDDAAQQWISGLSADKRHRRPMTGISVADDGSHRNRYRETSVLRQAIDKGKDRLKTPKDTRRSQTNDSGCRFRRSAEKQPTPLRQVMHHYVALEGKALTKDQTSAFYRRFSKSAKALLEAYSQNVQEAKDAITKIVKTTALTPADP